MGNEQKKSLHINCGLACLLNDREGVLDAYDRFSINTGTFIASPEVNAKLNAKGAKINAGSIQIKEVKGKIVQLDSGAVIDGRTDYAGLFILVNGDLVLKGDGVRGLGQTEGAIVTGTLYYPDSGDLAALVNVSGKKRAYPDGATVLLGYYDLEKAVVSAAGAKHIWVSGKVTALNRKTLEEARAAGIKISCGLLFTYEGLNAAFGDIFNCADRDTVPDGYEITEDLESAKLPLYGPKIYVNGDFSMEEKDLPALEQIEHIIVKGTAKLPASTVQIFRKKGKAGDYTVFEGRIIEIHGFQQFGHGQFTGSASPGEKIALVIHGCLLFDDDVTAEDVACIVSITYHGTVLASPAVQAALTPKVKEAHGFMGDSALIEKVTGQTLQELIAGHFGGKPEEPGAPDTATINSGVYILI
jgi:hypothetical protein